MSGTTAVSGTTPVTGDRAARLEIDKLTVTFGGLHAAFNNAGGGAMLRAAKVCRNGRRSIRSSISAPGLRVM